MTCFDCKVCFGSKFTSSAEGRRFNWLIYDSMTSLFACGRFSKSRGLSASVSFLRSFPFPFPLFYSLHSSPCNSLLPNCTETLATLASYADVLGLVTTQATLKLAAGNSFVIFDCTTPGSAKFDLGPKPHPRQCPTTLSHGASTRRGRLIGGGKCSFSA